MKLATSSTTLISTLLALSASVSANSCVRQDNALYTYIVHADSADGASGICNGLWDNLQRFASCVASNTNCDETGGTIDWSFDVGRGCDGGSVESAWWEATRNNYGSIDCP
ncbi:hypothetical protein BDW62DRAFT_210256 [Aspergillus aurantiobrunneus]